MKAREINMKIATDVFGHEVFKEKGILTERRPIGDRPLRNYCTDMEWAWEVADKMKMTIIPTNDNQWFAFVGSTDKQEGWSSPTEALEFLHSGEFSEAGAALNDKATMAICLAALKAVEKRSMESVKQLEQVTFASDPLAAKRQTV